MPRPEMAYERVAVFAGNIAKPVRGGVRAVDQHHAFQSGRQLRELQGLTGSRAAPRLLVGDLNLPSTVLLAASRRGWPETGRLYATSFDPNISPCNTCASVSRPPRPMV